MAELEILTTMATQQTADLQRVAKQVGADIVPYIKRIESGIEDILRPYYDKTITAKRQERILKDINELTNFEYGEYLKDFNVSMKAISGEEVAASAMALDVAIESDVDINEPKKSEINHAVIATPIQQGDKSWATYKGIQSSFKSQYVDEISSALVVSMQGAENGKDVADAAYAQLHYTGRKASKSVLDRSRRSANSMAATTANHVANVTRVQFGEANKKLIKGYVFIAVLDSVTSQTCRAGDQTTMEADNPKFSAWSPPRHRNALLKGSLITTDKGQVQIEHVSVGDAVLTHNGNYKEVYTVMCKPNDRLVRKVVLSNGSVLHSTDEHPILTKDNGWVNCSDVKVGDQVFYSGHNITKPNYGKGPKIDHGILSNSHNLVTEVAEELISYGIFSNSRGMTSSVNLDNHIANDKICDVFANGDLKPKLDAEIVKVVDKDLLMPGRVVSMINRARDSGPLKNSVNPNGVSGLHSFGRRLAASFVSLWHPVGPMINALGVGVKFSAINNRLYPSLSLNPELNAPFANSVVAKPVLSLNATKAFSFAKMFFLNKLNNLFVASNFHDNPLDCLSMVTVTEIVEYHYKGYVYNLAVKDDETYVAEGVVVHNCRSALSYDVNDRYKLDEDSTKRASSFRVDGLQNPKPVSSKGIYYQKIIDLDMSAFDMDQILGATLGKAFRKGLKDGTLTPESFAKLTVDSLYQPLTLKQMSERNNALGEILRKQKG